MAGGELIAFLEAEMLPGRLRKPDFPRRDDIGRDLVERRDRRSATAAQPYPRVGGKALDGMLAPSGPFPVAEQLPDSSPIKKTALDFKAAYQAKFGPVSPFAGYSYDAYLWLNAAIPVALKKAKPGSVEFREALRVALESIKDVAGTQAVYSLSPANHNGVDRRGRVMVRVEGGTFKVIP